MESEKTEGSKFYYVSADEKRVLLTFRHATLISAYNEAERLAVQENKPFFVLGTIVRVVPKPITTRTEDTHVYTGFES